MISFFTEEQYRKLLLNGGSEHKGEDHKPPAKLFLPGTGFTWLISEINPYEPDIAFGLCDMGMGCPEIRDISISELEELRHPYWEICVKCDFSFKSKYPISVYAEAARMIDRITEDENMLEQAFTINRYLRNAIPK